MQIVTNRNFSEYFRSRLHCIIICFMRGVTADDDDGKINKVFPLLIQKPKFVFLVREDNQSSIKMATGTKFPPRTKHITFKYHHFISNVKSGQVEITHTPTDEQPDDILTKPLSNEAFFTLRYMLCGWGYTPKQG